MLDGGGGYRGGVYEGVGVGVVGAGIGVVGSAVGPGVKSGVGGPGSKVGVASVVGSWVVDGVGVGVHSTGTGGISTGTSLLGAPVLVDGVGAPSSSTGGNHGVRSGTGAASIGVSSPVTMTAPVSEVVTWIGSAAAGRVSPVTGSMTVTPAPEVPASDAPATSDPMTECVKPSARAASAPPPRSTGAATIARPRTARETTTGTVPTRLRRAAACRGAWTRWCAPRPWCTWWRPPSVALWRACCTSSPCLIRSSSDVRPNG